MMTKLALAQVACNNREYAEAFRLLESHLRHHDDGRAWEMLGVARQAVSDFEQSVSALEQASIRVPLLPSARICLAIGYGRLGRTQLSRDLLIELIHDNEMTAEHLLDVATGLDQVAAPNQAARACRKAISADPGLAQPYYALGYYASKCGQPPEYTISLACQAISLEPECVTYRVGLASLLSKLSRPADSYEVVKGLSELQICAIHCSCCVERLAQIFSIAGDVPRADLCVARYFDLQAANGPTESIWESEE